MNNKQHAEAPERRPTAKANGQDLEERGVVFKNQATKAPLFVLPPSIDLSEWIDAKLTPACIVDGYLFADVAQMVGVGGVAKTTLAVFEAVHIILGRPLYGRAVLRPGPVLLITAEDARDQLVARTREICKALGLGEQDRAKVCDQLRIADLSGCARKLTAAERFGVTPSDLADEICIAAGPLAPVLVAFDPQVSFSAGEHLVNAGEQAMIDAARIIRTRLGCTVRFAHHTGKTNAREAVTDAYAGRGGTAMPDGCRMVAVLQRLKPDAFRKATGHALRRGQAGLCLTQPKNSYIPPDPPPVYLIREGFAFEVVDAPIGSTNGPSREAVAEQVLNLLRSQQEQGRLHGRRSLFEGCAEEAGLTKLQIDGAVAMLVADGRVDERQRPRVGKGGGGKYLHALTASERADRGVQAMGGMR